MNDMIVKIGDKRKVIKVLDEEHVSVDSIEHSVGLSKVSDYLYLIKIDNNVYEVTTTRNSSTQYSFSIDGRFIEATVRTSLQEKANEVLREREALSKNDKVKAPMPGLLLKILKRTGEKVDLGEPIIVLEAMKMENEIRSPSSGKVSEINYKEGDSVEKDSIILKIE